MDKNSQQKMIELLTEMGVKFTVLPRVGGGTVIESDETDPKFTGYAGFMWYFGFNNDGDLIEHGAAE